MLNCGLLCCQMTSHSGSGSLACVCVVTTTKLLMRHGDVQTSFSRTLGSANITDVTGLLIDPLVRTYAVVVSHPTDQRLHCNR